ncbi:MULTISPECIES: MarR family transcriptional regulator [Rhizobium]|uniref:MarR family transcriptional regulator n=1 Tax=Rhizobium tropici TaxID=398 RepID=A0A329Y9I0_RHITR|nr:MULTISPECIES: MarR family transcriptional regulator [Rhizobium]MBB3288743.1 DNA-binding MarR family transcriptional regulator [Rhizobium sp. BK252]MBB3403485.1 DNA-binding MarR family transcriptional regulator [Rhizobium sp. BK289]MBB3416330.1 DNA-binding MarR family transcriptional regulator [Rhizobium sp. BK284]MBB3483948.1 DNA-binding MarR family transcriptional regulator [Rhizobium sp. BK347]MDK4720370.1 MarR family transcriptional regulator [Rhizobium sp. CNPSo 3968]
MNSTPTLGFLLHDVARLFRKRFEQRAKDLGLTRSQWQTLAYLANNEGIHQAGLAEMLEIEPITLVRILDKLSERGLVERRQHPSDRRSWLLYMREEARPLIETMRNMGDQTRKEALEGTSQEDQERLYELLTLMKSNLLSACRSKAVDKELQHG